jgi:hypothetical protein
MTPAGRSVTAIVWLGVAGLLGVSVLFAPVIHGGWCADAPLAEASMCGTFQRSLIGVDTNVWTWLVAVAVVIFATIVAIRRRRNAME